jgi:putative ABC transport system permease protein
MTILDRVRAVIGRKRPDPDLQNELVFHLESEIRKNIASGIPPEEARRQALIAFGGVQQTKERVREMQWRHTLDTITQDLKYAFRMLRKSPVFTTVALLTVALGVSANTAIFSAVVSVLYPDWGVRKPEQIVSVREATTTNTGYMVSVPNFEDYRRQQNTFQELSLWINQSINLTGAEKPERLVGGFVSANFFDMLGVSAHIGRTFLAGEDQPGAGYVAVLGFTAWQTRFGADAEVIGRQIILNNESYTIVGVLPRKIESMFPIDAYITAQHHPGYKLDRQAKPLLIMGRLKDGISRAQAAADLNATASRLARDFPETNTGIHIEVESMREELTGDLRTPLLALMGAVALVLLIVCSNLASLLLARGLARQREIAVRAALGAARTRLVRQFLCESMLIAVSGGAIGLALANPLLTLLRRLSPVQLDLSGSAVLDLRVLVFAAALSMLTGLLFGMAPALQFSRVDLARSLTSGTRAAGTARSRLRSALVVSQLAISVVLLVNSSMLIKSLYALLNSSPGFATDHLLTMEYRVPRNKYSTPESQASFHRQVQERIRQVPGVISAAYVQALPFSGNWGEISFTRPGGASQPHQPAFTAITNLVSPTYFSTAQIPVLRGRTFTEHDDLHSSPVVIISSTFVRQILAGEDPLGKELEFTDTTQATDGGSPRLRRATIVGVVGDVKQLTRRETIRPEIYFSYTQVPGIFGTLMIRTATNPMSLSEEVKKAVWSIDKDQPVWKIRTVEFLLDRDIAPARFLVVLMSFFGGVALLLSALGTFGMLNNSVQQRMHELAIRMALGARPADVRSQVLGKGLRLAFIGGLAGLPAAALASRLLNSLFYGVASSDVLSFVLAWVGMTLIAVVASYVPARRATRVDPLVALRYE